MAPKCDPQTFVRGKIFSEPLIYEPGQGFTYSDLGFILLSFIIQLETSFSLDQFTRKFIYEALGLKGDLMFKPYEIADRIAPTRPDDPPGLVNDLNARSLGGVQDTPVYSEQPGGSLKWPDRYCSACNPAKPFLIARRFRNSVHPQGTIQTLHVAWGLTRTL